MAKKDTPAEGKPVDPLVMRDPWKAAWEPGQGKRRQSHGDTGRVEAWSSTPYVAPIDLDDSTLLDIVSNEDCLPAFPWEVPFYTQDEGSPLAVLCEAATPRFFPILHFLAEQRMDPQSVPSMDAFSQENRKIHWAKELR